jgi:hypothetical protein
MKNSINSLLVFILILVISVYSSGTVFGKSDNANGNSGKSEEHKSVVVGNVDSVVGNKVTVEDKKGKTETEVSKTTQVVHQNSGKGSTSQTIKKNDKVAIVSEDSTGSTESGKIKKAVKVFVKEATSSAQSKRQAVQGIISGINGSTITITHQIHRDRTFTVQTDSSTLIKIKGTENGSLASLQVGQRVIVIGDTTASGLLAKRIHVIPGKANGIFKKNPISSSSASPIATVSASPSASSSATPVPTPTPTPTASPEATATPTP